MNDFDRKVETEVFTKSCYIILLLKITHSLKKNYVIPLKSIWLFPDVDETRQGGVSE